MGFDMMCAEKQLQIDCLFGWLVMDPSASEVELMMDRRTMEMVGAHLLFVTARRYSMSCSGESFVNGNVDARQFGVGHSCEVLKLLRICQWTLDGSRRRKSQVEILTEKDRESGDDRIASHDLWNRTGFEPSDNWSMSASRTLH